MSWRLVRDRAGEGDPADVEGRLALKRIEVSAMNFGGGMVALFVALGFFGLVFFAQYSGALRWALVFVLSLAVAAVALRFVNLGTRDPEAGAEGEDRVARHPGAVRKLAAILERADAGLKYSQVMAEERLREAFLHRARIVRGATAADVAAAREDPEGLYRLLGDKDLALFCLRSARNSRIWPSVLGSMPKRPRFWKEFLAILERTEAWR